MQNKKLIGIIEAFKGSFKTVFVNENLGYIVKIYLVIAATVTALILPIYVGSFFITLGTFSKTNSFSATNPNAVLFTSNVDSDNEFSSDALVSKSAKHQITISDMVTGFIIFYIVVLIVLILAACFITTMLTLSYIHISDGKLTSVRQLAKESVKKMWKFLFLCVLLTIIIGIGYVLLVVPGIIFTIMFMFSPFIMLRENLGVIESMKKSKQLVSGYKMGLFSMGVKYQLLMMATILPLGLFTYSLGPIASIILGGINTIVLLKFYYNLMELKSQTTPISPVDTQPMPATPITPAEIQTL